MPKLYEPAVLIDRPWWRRIGFLAAIAFAVAVPCAIFDILTGDVLGGRAISLYASGGSMALWPRVSVLLVGLPVLGGIVGALLPLYRRRRGGAALGLTVYALVIGAMCVGSALTGADSGFGPLVLFGAGRGAVWQRITFLLILAVLSARLGAMFGSAVLGARLERVNVVPPVA